MNFIAGSSFAVWNTEVRLLSYYRNGDRVLSPLMFIFQRDDPGLRKTILGLSINSREAYLVFKRIYIILEEESTYQHTFPKVNIQRKREGGEISSLIFSGEN